MEALVRWTDRQAAMLEEMGIQLWSPPAGPDEPAADVSPAAESEVASATAAPGPAHSPARPAVQAERLPELAPHPSAPLTLRNRPAGIEAMEWEALREAVAGCTACKLCNGRTQTVFGVGHPRAHWMIVGEAPGEQEDLQGEPFVGKSGQLLD